MVKRGEPASVRRHLARHLPVDRLVISSSGSKPETGEKESIRPRRQGKDGSDSFRGYSSGGRRHGRHQARLYSGIGEMSTFPQGGSRFRTGLL